MGIVELSDSYLTLSYGPTLDNSGQYAGKMAFIVTELMVQVSRGLLLPKWSKRSLVFSCVSRKVGVLLVTSCWVIYLG